MDFGSFEIGGVGVIVLVLGLTEAAKRLGVTGKGSQVLALCLGAFFVGLSAAIGCDLIPVVALPWIEVGVMGLGGALAATGIYDLGKRFMRGNRVTVYNNS